jgi:hypothetical protein
MIAKTHIRRNFCASLQNVWIFSSMGFLEVDVQDNRCSLADLKMSKFLNRIEPAELNRSKHLLQKKKTEWMLSTSVRITRARTESERFSNWGSDIIDSKCSRIFDSVFDLSTLRFNSNSKVGMSNSNSCELIHSVTRFRRICTSASILRTTFHSLSFRPDSVSSELLARQPWQEPIARDDQMDGWSIHVASFLSLTLYGTQQNHSISAQVLCFQVAKTIRMEFCALRLDSEKVCKDFEIWCGSSSDRAINSQLNIFDSKSFATAALNFPFAVFFVVAFPRLGYLPLPPVTWQIQIFARGHGLGLRFVVRFTTVPQADQVHNIRTVKINTAPPMQTTSCTARGR